MIISVPRSLIVTLGVVFSAYHLVLAAVAIDIPRDPIPYVLAMVLYAAATTASLWPSRDSRMPVWLATSNVAVAVAVPLLVTSQFDSETAVNTYAAWHTAAIGTLMVITSTRHRQTFAWLGASALTVQTFAWGGFGSLVAFGVVGSLVWVGTSHVLAHSVATAGRDAAHYAIAEREAAEWRAAQEAHVFERQFRLGQTSRMSLPMLRQIQASGGELTEAQRLECRYLEGAIRDEIRGRKLLNDRVRVAVMGSRRRGTVVTLLDEGGIDDLPEHELERVLNRLAAAIRETRADRIIARTVPEGSDVAVTVVGLSSSSDGIGTMLGQESDDDEASIDLWLEIPRELTHEPVTGSSAL